MIALIVLTLTVAGLLVGNELAVAIFVHPTLSRLPDHVHLAGAAALAHILGRAMPFWYALTIVLTSALALVDHRHEGHWSLPITLSAALWVLSIVYTITALVPINNRIKSWTEDNRPSNWKVYRSKWDRLHRWRVLLLGVAFLCLTVGTLTTSCSVCH